MTTSSGDGEERDFDYPEGDHSWKTAVRYMPEVRDIKKLRIRRSDSGMSSATRELRDMRLKEEEELFKLHFPPYQILPFWTPNRSSFTLGFQGHSASKKVRSGIPFDIHVYIKVGPSALPQIREAIRAALDGLWSPFQTVPARNTETLLPVGWLRHPTDRRLSLPWTRLTRRKCCTTTGLVEGITFFERWAVPNGRDGTAKHLATACSPALGSAFDFRTGTGNFELAAQAALAGFHAANMGQAAEPS